MAWQYPTHACGHTGERYQAYGPGRDRDRQLSAIERQECPSCRAAATQASTPELPALAGSDKQIAWAGEMRKAALSNPAATIAAAGIPVGLAPYAMRAIEIAKRQTQSRWWIDNRPFAAWLRERVQTLITEDQITTALSEDH